MKIDIRSLALVLFGAAAVGLGCGGDDPSAPNELAAKGNNGAAPLPPSPSNTPPASPITNASNSVDVCAIESLKPVLKDILPIDPATGKPTTCTITYRAPDLSNATPAELSSIIKKGVQAWRTKQFDGRSCLQCHGPDMIEFAYLDFGNGNMLRRGLGHVVPQTLNEIMDAIYAMRTKYRIAPKDPDAFRPLQPGGAVLGDVGGTSQSRDVAFAQYLEAKKMILMSQRIGFDPNQVAASVDLARKAKAELGEVNLAQLQVGIPFSRWSEDAFHGPEHRTFNKWIPEVEQIFSDEARVHALQDTYLANPTDANFGAMLMAVYGAGLSRGDAGKTSAGGGQLNDQKYLSVLLATHFMRMEVLKAAQSQSAEFVPGRMSALEDLPTVKFPYLNGMWNVANILHNGVAQGLTANLSLTKPLTMTDLNTYFTTTATPNFKSYAELSDAQQTQLLRETEKIVTPWFWMGWILDPTLKFVIRDDMIPGAGEYFALHLLQDLQGYPLHTAFMIAKKNVAMLDAPPPPVVAQTAIVNTFQTPNPATNTYLSTTVHRSEYWPYTNTETQLPIAGVYNAGMQGQAARAPRDRILTGAFPETMLFNESKVFGYRDLHLAGGHGLTAAGKDDNRISGTHLQLYQTFTGNMYRMFLLLMVDALNGGGQPGFVRALSDKINKAELFFQNAVNEPSYEGSDNQKLVQLVRARLGIPATGGPGLSVPGN